MTIEWRRAEKSAYRGKREKAHQSAGLSKPKRSICSIQWIYVAN